MDSFGQDHSAHPYPHLQSEEEIERRRVVTTNRLCNLPLFSQGAMKLLAIAIDDEGAKADFEDVFRSDPALASELLLLANSVEFGFRARISSIGHALMLLGLERTRSLASRIAMSFYLRSSTRKEVRTVWSHSVATAILAEYIVTLIAAPAPLFYTAALVHDVGSLGLLLTSHEQYAELIALKLVEHQAAIRIERTLFGLSHADAGGVLADHWGFPPALRRCMSDHHGQVSEFDDLLLNIVQVSCRLASALGFAEAFVDPSQRLENPIDVLPPDLRHRSEFSPERLYQLLATKMAAQNPEGLAKSILDDDRDF